MTTTTDRYEYRAFARNFGIVEQRLRARILEPRLQESRESYIVSATVAAHNVKIRGGLLDIKSLVGSPHGLERWTPALKTPLPVADADAERKIIAALDTAPPPGGLGQYDERSFIEQWVRRQPGLVAAAVFKRRLTGRVGGCLCEMTEVAINGAWCMTACVESVEWREVLAVAAELGVAAYANENYVQAIRRVTGLVPATAVY